MTKTVTTTAYLYARQADWMDDNDGVYYSIATFKYEDKDLDGRVILGEMEISMDVPEVNINDMFVDSMRAQQDKIKVEAHLKVENLEEQIQSLLALPAPLPND